MNVGFDMDEILAELTIGFQSYLTQNHNVHLTKEQLIIVGLEKELGWTHEQVLETLYSFFDTELFKNLPPVPYSREGLEAVAAKYPSYVITARSHKVYDQTKYCQWPVDENITTKPKICKMLEVQVMVEDSLKQAYDCAKQEVKVLLLDYPWNKVSEKLPENIKRVYSWKEIVEEIGRYDRIKRKE